MSIRSKFNPEGIKWDFAPELSYRWKNAEIPDEIVRIYREQGEAACIAAIRRSPATKQKHSCRIYIGTDIMSGKPSYLRKVYYGSDIAVYSKKFDKEYTQMKSIQSKLFPMYYEKDTTQSLNPYVTMEYFPPDKFITLETHLRRQHTSNKFSEQRLITDELFMSLIENLHEALSILYQKGLLYLDLQPENILIDPKTNAIRLVDFTHCYDYTAIGYQEIKLADDNLVENSPLAVLLTRQFGLLIARLHYAGDTAYRNFASDVDIFTAKYYPVFDDILYRDGKDPMEENYWDCPDYQKDIFIMYERRYESFKKKLAKERFMQSSLY